MKQIIYIGRLDHVLIHMIHVSRGPARDTVSEFLFLSGPSASPAQPLALHRNRWA